MSPHLLLTVIGFNAVFLLLPACVITIYRRPDYWQTTLAVFLGYLVGFVNLATDEVQFPVLLLLAFGFFVGFASKQRAVVHAILLAIWVPIGQGVHMAIDHESVKFVPEFLGSFIAFI